MQGCSQPCVSTWHPVILLLSFYGSDQKRNLFAKLLRGKEANDIFMPVENSRSGIVNVIKLVCDIIIMNSDLQPNPIPLLPHPSIYLYIYCQNSLAGLMHNHIPRCSGHLARCLESSTEIQG